MNQQKKKKEREKHTHTSKQNNFEIMYRCTATSQMNKTHKQTDFVTVQRSTDFIENVLRECECTTFVLYIANDNSNNSVGSKRHRPTTKTTK